MIHRLGYEYQWKMLLNELYAQMKMENKDPESFIELKPLVQYKCSGDYGE